MKNKDLIFPIFYWIEADNIAKYNNVIKTIKNNRTTAILTFSQNVSAIQPPPVPPLIRYISRLAIKSFFFSHCLAGERKCFQINNRNLSHISIVFSKQKASTKICRSYWFWRTLTSFTAFIPNFTPNHSKIVTPGCS